MTLEVGLLEFVFDRSRMLALADRLRGAYRDAVPYPHTVITDLFPDALPDAVIEECDAIEPDLLHTTANKRVVKRETGDAAVLGPATRFVLAQLDSSPFLDFLESLTGISGLVPDPHHAGGGLHETPRDGFALVHRDFLSHTRLGLERRVNALLYLNRDWPEEYGGHLELWPEDMSGARARILPAFNTLVVFESNAHTLHGLPDPVRCPPDRMRRSLVSYTYTATRPVQERAAGRGRMGIYARRPQDRWTVAMPSASSLATWLLPQPVKARLVSVRRRVRYRRRGRPAT
jgi:hypothetical protein